MATDATPQRGDTDSRRALPRVFLVEDSHLLLERLEYLLAGVADVVGHAESAKVAIDVIPGSLADAVVLDLVLKEGSGVEVLRAIRTSSPQVAVFVLTNSPIPHYRRIALSLGARGFYDKSTEFTMVRDAIASLALPPELPN